MNSLKTDDGQIVEVIKSGNLNTDSGPDFFNAQIRLSGTLWAGNVEIHILSSDWHRHNHHHDSAYDNCILHVVYENDSKTFRTDGSVIPTIELKNRILPYLWENYLKLIGNRGWISCQPRIKEIDENTWRLTIDRMIYERLEHKATQIINSVDENKGDWEEGFYIHLAHSFGFRLNAVPFEMLARSLPLKYIGKERSSLINIEALIFGQAGMLSGKFEEEYPNQLQEIYRHFCVKYSLKNISFSSWKFLRLRPVNFPAIRLAQFSSLLFNNPSLFRNLVETNNIEKTIKNFYVQASEYWNTHFYFDKPSAFSFKRLGSSSVNSLLINTLSPFLYAWGNYTSDSNAKQKAFDLLLSIPAEENNLIRKWKELGIIVHSAVDTQALIQLKLMHCSEKKCLTCSIGNTFINILP